jgi:putative ABC transport system permease protein
VWRATIKSLLARKLRLALTALAIVLGVGFMSGTLVLTDTATRSFDELFGNVFSGTDLVVQADRAFVPGPSGAGGGGGEERNPIPGEVLHAIREVDGVAAADGDVAGYAQVIDPVTGEAIQTGGAPTIGASWDPNTSTLELREGEPPAAPNEVAVDAATAREHHLEVGDEVRVVTQAGSDVYTITGIVGVAGQESLLGATLTVFEIGTAQRLFDREGVFDRILVVGEEGTAPADLQARVQALLPEGYRAVSAASAAAEASADVRQGLGFLRTGLLVFAFVALFVGAFIIFNTFNIIVTQRTRELALLRALGARRRQVMASVVVESAVVGLLASAVGALAGLGLALGLKQLFGALGLDLPATGLVVLPRTIVVALAVGTLVTMAASVGPARRASRVAPLQALRESSAPSASLRRRAVVGSILVAGGLAALGIGLFGDVANAALVVGVGAQLTFVGVAVVSPLFARPLAAGIGRPFRRKVSGRLGGENATRNPRRTASTSAALMVGLGLVTFVAVFAASLKASASAALDEILRADLTLSGANFTPFSPEVARRLAADPAFAAVAPLRQGEVRIGDRMAFLSGIDPAAMALTSDTEMVAGSLDSLGASGTVVIYEGIAETKGLEVGDELAIRFARTGEASFRIGGIHSDNRLLSDYAISLADFEANFGEQLDLIVFLKVAEGVPLEQARAAVEEILEDFPNVTVRDQAEFKEQQAREIDRFILIVYALLLLSVIISVFGIVNTLGLSIYERVREIGLLRAVGMSRAQIKAMVRAEAVIVALLGAVLGLAIGILFGVAMQLALADVGIERLAVPLGQLAGFLVIAALLGVVAAIFPARRAANLDVLQAIAYE